MDTQPFLTTAAFAAMIAPRTLTAGETLLVDLLVQAAADWVRDPARLPGLLTTDPRATQAKLLTYDVVLSALTAPGVDPKIRQVMTAVDSRQTSITYADAARLLQFDDRHLVMLGLSTTAPPQAFYGTDTTGTYGGPDSFASAFTDPGPRRW